MYPGIHCLYVFARILHLLWANFHVHWVKQNVHVYGKGALEDTFK